MADICPRCLKAKCRTLLDDQSVDSAVHAWCGCALRTAARAESAEKQLAEMQDVADRYFAQVQRENSALVHYRDKLHEANRLLNVYRVASIRDEELHRVLFAALGKATDWDARSTVDGAKSAGVEAVKSLVAKIAAVREELGERCNLGCTDRFCRTVTRLHDILDGGEK